jgi:hypothetical protein
MVYPFSPFPPGFEQSTINMKPKGVCYLIVHAGYATYTDAGAEVITSVDAYGDYSAYLERLKGLMRRLREYDALVVCAIEERALRDRNLLAKELRPSHRTLRIVTKDSSGRIQPSFIDADGFRRNQHLDWVMDFLRSNGIEEVRVAGELAWFPGPNGYRGCLTTLANEFLEEGFRVRGVEGCVYPVNPLPSAEFLHECLAADTWLAQRWRDLYGPRPREKMAADPVLASVYSETVKYIHGG